MNSTRHTSMGIPGRSRQAPVWICALVTTLLCLSNLFSTNPSLLSDRLGPSLAAHPASMGGAIQECRPIQTALLYRTATRAAAMAFMAPGLFALPADTETTDTETTVAKPAKPVFSILAGIVRASWQPTTARCVSVPLYIYHQALLC